MLLPNLALLVRIAEKGGLAAAGRDFGLSPATVSERLVSLEAHYGAKLINRTTRSISLTDEGRILVDGAKRLLAEADELEAMIRHGAEKLSGPIKVSAPFDLGSNRIAPLLDKFLALHPNLQIDLSLTDGYVDLVAQGIDIAVRFGNLKDSQLHARKIGENRRIVCASPDYIKRHGTPQHPNELQNHNCILMRFGESIDNEWSFRSGTKDFTVRVKGNRITNDGAQVRKWCVQGFGIVLKSIWDVEHHLARGELVQLLADFAPPPSSLQIVYASGQGMPRRIRMLIDHLVQHLTAGQLVATES
jgi:DNA-binding transcriptional LysR family regulator